MEQGRGQFLLGLILGASVTAVAAVLLALLIPLSLHDRPLQDSNQVENRVSKSEESDSDSKQSNGEQQAMQETPPTVENRSMQDPGQLWKSLTSDDVNDAEQVTQLIQTAETWLDDQGVAILEQIHSTPMDPALRETFMQVVLARTSKLGWSKRLEQVAELTGLTREWAMDEIALDWAKRDPRAALQAASSLPESDIYRRVLQRIVAVAWAEREPDVVLAELEVIPDNVRSLVEESAIMATARRTPESAVEFLAAYFGNPQESILAKEIAAYWVESDANAAIAWARSQEFSSEDIRNEVMDELLRTYAKSDPETALQIALQTPINNVGLEAGVIEVAASRNVDLALEMLERVRSGETSDTAYGAVGRIMVMEHQDFERAIELGQRLAPNRREFYYNVMSIFWGAERAGSLLEHMESFPEKWRSSVAKNLLIQNQATLALTSKQIDRAKTYLNPTDLLAIELMPKQHRRVIRFRVDTQDGHEH
ncbi:MAG: hypothetical protein OXG08_02955 [Gammaproteobacteria bacterium]|nr:hypothetical protein [Gammaproteobacteria bacterium]